MAPSITESLFALGLGSHVVGRTQHCNFPRQTSEIKSIGDPLSPSLEAILSLNPDTIIGLSEQRTTLNAIGNNSIATILIDHRSVLGFLESLTKIGEICGIKEDAQELRAGIESHLKVSAKKRFKRVAVIVASSGVDFNNELFLSGNDGFYDSLIELAGSQNVYRGQTVRVPTLSPEGMYALNPDLIIVISSSPQRTNQELGSIRSLLPNVKIVTFSEDYAQRPGPRMVKLFDDIVQAIDTL